MDEPSFRVEARTIGQVAGRDINNGAHPHAADELRLIGERLDALLLAVREGHYGTEAATDVAPPLEEARDAAESGDLAEAGSRLAVAADRARRVGTLAAAIASIIEPVRVMLGK